MKGPSHQTSGRPTFLTLLLFDDSEKIIVEDPKIILAGIRMLLYLMKHSKPDIANTTGELFKVINRVNQAAFLEMN